MNDNDIDILIYRILSGETWFNYDGNDFVLKSPSIDIKYQASLLYDQILNEEKYQNWIREDNAENVMISLGIWDTKTNDILKGLYKRLDDLKVTLFKAWMMPTKQKSIRKDIDHIKKELSKILVVKQEFLSHTLEGYASSIKQEYIICKTLYSDNKLVFDYNTSNNKSFVRYNNLNQEINNLSINNSQYKELARHETWRSYWTAGKSHNIFDVSVRNWTDDQRMMYKISKMYDNIYEHPECPEDIVLSDDDMLDGWMILQQREQTKAKKEKSLDNTASNLRDASEVFLFPQNQEEFSDIMSLNSEAAKMEIKEKMDFVAKKGEVEEYEMPDVQRKLQHTIRELNRRERQK